MVSLVTILSLMLVILVFYKTWYSIWIIPVYSVIVDLVSGFVITGSKIGSIRAITLVIAILISIIRRKRIYNGNHTSIYFFILYLALISHNSSNFEATIYGIVTTSIIFLSYIWGTKYLINVYAWKLFFKGLIAVGIFAVTYLAVLQFFHINTTVNMNYSELFNTGGLMASRMDTLAYISVFLLFIILNRREYLDTNFKLYAAILLLSIIWIVLLITLKRTTILIVIIGVGIIFYKRKQKKSLFRYTLIFSFLLVILFYFFQGIILEQFTARAGKFETSDLSEEYRYKEAELLYNDVFTAYNLEQILFGSNLFYTKPFGADKFGRDRIIHSDITSLMYGGGAVCIILFFSIFIKIYSNYIRLGKEKDRAQEALFLSFFFMTIFVTIPGGFIHNITGSIIAMAILGGSSQKYFAL